MCIQSTHVELYSACIIYIYDQSKSQWTVIPALLGECGLCTGRRCLVGSKIYHLSIRAKRILSFLQYIQVQQGCCATLGKSRNWLKQLWTHSLRLVSSIWFITMTLYWRHGSQNHRLFFKRLLSSHQRTHQTVLLVILEGNPNVHGGFPSKNVSNAESVSM